MYKNQLNALKVQHDQLVRDKATNIEENNRLESQYSKNTNILRQSNAKLKSIQEKAKPIEERLKKEQDLLNKISSWLNEYQEASINKSDLPSESEHDLNMLGQLRLEPT